MSMTVEQHAASIGMPTRASLRVVWDKLTPAEKYRHVHAIQNGPEMWAEDEKAGLLPSLFDYSMQAGSRAH
jgi:hypothetical protein